MLIQVERVSFWMEHSLRLPLGTNENSLVLDEVDLCGRLGLQLPRKFQTNRDRKISSEIKNVKLEAKDVF